MNNKTPSIGEGNNYDSFSGNLITKYGMIDTPKVYWLPGTNINSSFSAFIVSISR